MVNDIYNYWGKADKDGTYHLLIYHCLDVAAVGKVWMEQSPAFVKRSAKASGLSEKAFTEWFLFFLALHDIGKFDVRFQNLKSELLRKLENKKVDFDYTTRHDQRGFEFWDESLRDNICSRYFSTVKGVPLREYLDIFALVTLGHHGIPPKNENRVVKLPEAVSQFTDSLFELLLSECAVGELTEIFSLPKEERKERTSQFKYHSWQLAGLTTLCDWIASGDESFVYSSEVKTLKEYFSKASKKAVKALQKAETVSSSLSAEMGINRLFPEFADRPTPLQQYCDKVTVMDKPQLFILEDVAGAGKTEASLILASQILKAGGGSGSFVALPTMATSNAMYERMADVYHLFYSDCEKPSLTLSHGSRHLSKRFCDSYRSNLNELPQSGEQFDEDRDEGKAHCSQWLADSSKKALLADVGVGTVDQILIAGLPVRYQSLRAFGMAQKVLIVDEVHAFDPYMLRLLENVIAAQAAFGASVILLSATLPISVRKRFCAAFAEGLNVEAPELTETEVFPLITAFSSDGFSETGVNTRLSVAREVDVAFHECVDEVYEQIEKSVAEGKCVCWIRNTITDVMKSFEELQNRGMSKLDMFHSRFALKDRLVIEQRILERFGKNSTQEMRTGQILIASQVVEQSLDLDFDVMISDLAPIDLLIQRAGRLHRHNHRGDRGKPVFYLHIPKEPDEPTESWFSGAFPSAQWVYRDTALLWRTKEALKRQKRLKMPEEARLLIESVYGEETEINSPDVFITSEDSVWAEALNQKSIADFNRLKFEQGYSRLSSDMNKWENDEKVSTRLSDRANTLYLCQWEDEKIKPLFDGEQFAWDLSSLSCRASLLVSVEYNEKISEAIEELKKQKRFQFNTLFLVFKDEAMMLTGKNENGREVLVRYSSSGGLIVEKI